MDRRATSFFAPGKPLGKQRARSGQGRHYTPKATVNAEAYIKLLAAQNWEGPPAEGPIKLVLDITFEVPRSWSKKRREAAVGKMHIKKPDASNVQKLVEDAMNGVVYLDDAQIAFATIRKRYGLKPGVAVTVMEMEEDE